MASDNSNNDNTPALGIPNRYITTHDAEGKSIFSPAFPPALTPRGVPGMQYFEGYEVLEVPLNMTDEADLKAFQTHSATAPDRLHFPRAGTVLRYCDWAPGCAIPMHRTESIDFGTVLNGELELTLDSGEIRLMKPGDSIVQRGTTHAWRNPSATEHARAVFVVQGCPPVKVGGVEMTEVLPWDKKD